MGIDTFDKFILPAAVEKAQRKYWSSSPEYFFGMARNHDVDAINLLFASGKGVISRAFWKYYLGPNRAVWKQRIRDKDDWEFASEVYAMLLGNGKAANPLLTFDPSVYKDQPLPFVINKFNYYLMRYAQNLAWVMNREKNMEGMTGNLKKGDQPQFISKDIEAGGDDSSKGSIEGSFSGLGAEDTAYETTEQSIEVQQFLNFIKNKRPDLYQVAVLGANGYSPKDIEQKLGISAYHVKNKQAALKGEYMKNFAESVKKPLKEYGQGWDAQPFDTEAGQGSLGFYEGTFKPSYCIDMFADMLMDGVSAQAFEMLAVGATAQSNGSDPTEAMMDFCRELLRDMDDDVYIDEESPEEFKSALPALISAVNNWVRSI